MPTASLCGRQLTLKNVICGMRLLRLRHVRAKRNYFRGGNARVYIFFFAVVSDLRGEVGLMATIINNGNGANEACKNLALQYAGERDNEYRQRVSLRFNLLTD